MPFRKSRRNRNEFIPVKDRNPFFYLEHAKVEVDGDCLIFHQMNLDTKVPEVIPFPLATYQAVFFGPGISITHRAMALLASAGTRVIFTGDHLFVYYGNASISTHSSKNLMRQIELFSDSEKKMEVIRRMYRYRFPDTKITDKGLQAFLGMEGNRMTAIYKKEAKRTGVAWNGRSYDINDMDSSTPVNYALSIANHALYGVCASAEVALGYSTAIGFIHHGHMNAFTYDIADLYKAETTIPAAFEAVRDSKEHEDSDALRKRVHQYCHEYFHRARLLKRIPKDIAMLFDLDEEMQEQEILSTQIEVGDGLFHPDATNYGRKKP